MEWPADTFAGEKARIALCVYGDDPFGSTLDRATHSQTIGNRGFLVRRTTSLQTLKACQVAFVSNSESEQLPDILASVSGSNVLTVGESSHFAERGGFVLVGNKERFSINVDSMNRSQLKISSKLLALAVIVHDGPPQKEP